MKPNIRVSFINVGFPSISPCVALSLQTLRFDMITIKTMKQIPTARAIASFRAGGDTKYRQAYPANEPPAAQADRQRRMAGMAQALTQEHRRQWLTQAWQQRQPRG
jgi:hypothetical protein